VPPNLFKAAVAVAVLLVGIAVLVVAPWEHGNSKSRLDLATANDALAIAAPGAKISISSEELSSDDYPSNRAEPGAYPPALSKATAMTPEWHRFAAMVDRICAVSFNYMIAEEQQTRQIAYEQHWTDSRATAAMLQLSSDEDARILRATVVLGESPEEQDLFARWRANVAERTDLYRQAGRAALGGNLGLAREIFNRTGPIKDDSDDLGQHFGLRICTSN